MEKIKIILGCNGDLDLLNKVKNIAYVLRNKDIEEAHRTYNTQQVYLLDTVILV